MIASRHSTPWHLALLSLVALSLLPLATYGQDSPPEEPAAEAPAPPDQDQPAEESQASSDDAYPAPVSLTDSEPWTAFQYFDKPFEWMVGKMAQTLFYRVFSTERQYAQMDDVVYYVRDRGTDGPFVIAENSKVRKPANLPDQIDEEKVHQWAELGKISTSPNPDRDYRLGVLHRTDAAGKEKEQPVDYVLYVINNSTKYVRIKEGDKITFQPVTKLRNSLNEDESTWLTPEEIQKRAHEGKLALSGNNPPDTPYLFTEYVGGAPIVVLWLSGGAVFFTIFFAFVNFWGFGHAVSIVRGTYDNPDEPGEVTHFQALASALSATVGLGNIAGVTIAMSAGGPGAFFWMLLCGFFGMTSKFVECTLGQMYREVKPDGTILGGPMQYLTHAFAQFGLKPIGQVMAIIFAIMCIMASFGGGNMFQANQAASMVLTVVQDKELGELSKVKSELSAAASQGELEKVRELEKRKTELQAKVDAFESTFNPIFGIAMAFFVGLVIIGGIKRIGATASKVVPAMCLIYILACLWIIGAHITQLPELIAQIFTEAFNPEAVRGGILGVIVIGVQRAAFSNEAGVGSAAIAHSAAKTDEPVREGFVALLGPFIDTIVVCSMTALVILITGAWDNRGWILDQGLEGVQLTAEAFEAELWWFPYILMVAVVLFAFSTIVSWSYYGERCWERLFGARSIYVYKVIFVFAVFIGTIFELGSVLDFSDFMILSMAFPNILGALLLAPKVRTALGEYWKKYKAGEFKKFK
ncbi:Amino-acid carrier protein AlsT [Bremerella volcania]|uniref:Amino-acid carrier protein AlsT n=1 Tax=Bremerella volcania TaxID=2527984 RepID=A0A518C7I9_9BACT|nr:alanine/glycine:cation symporter family protein [Bremerella volcania]QDU75183.1 Amino-acid carrier protein AlsT [Bremerella volcania]